MMHYVYFIIFVLALIYWVYIRIELKRGLAAAFYQLRCTQYFNLTMERYLKSYICALVLIVLQMAFLWFIGYRLIESAGLWDWENALVLSVVISFLLKDRVYYDTAVFMLTKRIDKQ